MRPARSRAEALCLWRRRLHLHSHWPTRALRRRRGGACSHRGTRRCGAAEHKLVRLHEHLILHVHSDFLLHATGLRRRDSRVGLSFMRCCRHCCHRTGRWRKRTYLSTTLKIRGAHHIGRNRSPTRRRVALGRDCDEAESLQSPLELRAAFTLQQNGPRIRRSRWGRDRLVANRPYRRAVLGSVRL